MEQTAVEFISKGLFDILQEAEDNNIFEVGTQNFKRYIEMFLEQAKEMEKQQQGYSEEDMKEAFRIGFNLGCNAVESLTNEIAEEWFKNGLKKFKNK
jgi:hypothetical protein